MESVHGTRAASELFIYSITLTVGRPCVSEGALLYDPFGKE
jgi:hypothetical protein